jgi:hypothetical protein
MSESPVSRFYVSDGVGYMLYEKPPYSTSFIINDTQILGFGRGATQHVATKDKKELKRKGLLVRVVKHKPGKHYVYYATREYVKSIREELKKIKKSKRK